MPSSPDPGSPVVHRARSSQFLAAALIVLCAVGIGSTLVAHDGRTAGTVSLLLLIGYLAWWLLWYPSVRVDDEAVVLVNPITTVRISWHSVIHVEARFAATIVTPHGRFTAWAAPAPGMMTALSEVRRARREDRDSRSVRVGELRGTASGDVAGHVRDVVAQRAEAGVNDVALTESLRPSRHVHVLLLVVLAVLCLLNVAVTVWR